MPFEPQKSANPTHRPARPLLDDATHDASATLETNDESFTGLRRRLGGLEAGGGDFEASDLPQQAIGEGAVLSGDGSRRDEARRVGESGDVRDDRARHGRPVVIRKGKSHPGPQTFIDDDSNGAAGWHHHRHRGSEAVGLEAGEDHATPREAREPEPAVRVGRYVRERLALGLRRHVSAKRPAVGPHGFAREHLLAADEVEPSADLELRGPDEVPPTRRRAVVRAGDHLVGSGRQAREEELAVLACVRLGEHLPHRELQREPFLGPRA